MQLFQTLVDYIYRFPKSKYKTIKRFGGYISYYKMIYCKKLMRKASYTLPKIISAQHGYKIYFLTGKNYLDQTLFCALSLNKVSIEKYQFILVDDGSFTPRIIARIYNQMPGVQIITEEEIENNLQRVIPIEKFPYLRYKRKVYPHIRKLTDIHSLPDQDFKLVLDSDMLFWRNPSEIIDWLKKPFGAIHMLDCVESYGFPKELMNKICGNPIPSLINVGVMGIDSKIINWDEIETWSRNLETNGPSYFLEQALSAMLISNEKKISLNDTEYLVNPISTKPNSESIKLCHYVDLSKKKYFITEWKKLI